MRIGTNLIEFEESSEMKFFFELESPESKPSSLFIILDDRVLACIEIVRGTMDDGIDIMLEKSIEAEVNSLGGYISKLHEDFPDDISAKFTFNDKEVNQYHIFKYGKVSLTLHLTVLGNWLDDDLTKFHNFLKGIELHEEKFFEKEFGEVLLHENFSGIIGDKVGSRSYLGTQMVVVENL